MGKTIEAGLVLSQNWVERKRRILIIVPSNLRKQWHQELQEKFFLPCRILESKSYNEAVKQGNTAFFEAEAEKLDGWADDLKLGLEHEIKEFDRQIKEARRAAAAALTLEEKLGGQKQIKALEAQRNTKRRALFDAQDEIDRQREELITQIEGKLQQSVSQTTLFSIRWRLA